MVKELTEKDIASRRLRSCVMAFPGAESGEHNPRCCRFPKPCSPYGTIEAYQAGNLTERDLEPQRLTQSELYKQPVYQTEQKVLQPHRVGHSFRSTMTAEVDEFVELEKGRQVHKLEAFVLREHLADDHYDEVLVVVQPKTWWDHFKVDHLDTWWGRWLNSHFPPEFDAENHLVRVKVERYASYPEADIEIKQLGRPIPFERLRRLTGEEIEDMELQKTLEAKRAEVDEDDRMWLFMLVPEMFDELSRYTNLPREHFEAAYNYDQEFNLVSKIYLIPEGVGYRKKED